MSSLSFYYRHSLHLHIFLHRGSVSWNNYFSFYSFWGPVSIFKVPETVFLWSPGIDSKESIPPVYVARRVRISKLLRRQESLPQAYVAWRRRPVRQPNSYSVPNPHRLFKNSSTGSEGRYGNPIPTRFLAPLDCSKILAHWCLLCLWWTFG